MEIQKLIASNVEARDKLPWRVMLTELKKNILIYTQSGVALMWQDDMET